MAGSQDKPLMSWMYDGPKSLVNHEDYLLGRKMDKNFELFGNDDLQPKKSAGGLSSVLEKSPNRSSTGESSLLCLDTVKKEDPLVAIKVKEEQIRREIVQNPVRMKRLQKLIMSTMEKKMSKALADSLSDSSDSSADRKKSKKKKRKREKTGKRSRSRSPKRSRPRDYDRDLQRASHSSSYRDYRDSKRGDYSRIDNRRRETSPQNRRDDDRRPVDRKDHRNDRRRSKDETKRDRELEQKRGARIRHDSSESAEQSPERTDPITFLTVSSKASVEYSDSDSENERKKQKYSGYGLVGVKKTVNTSESKPKEKEPSWKNLKKPSPSPVSTKAPEKKRQLTEEEMEEKRKEMMQNAQWRNNQRDKNLKYHAKREKAEEAKEKREKGAASDFIRPMLAQVAETGTVESRIKSKLGSVQRKHGDMDSHFARK